MCTLDCSASQLTVAAAIAETVDVSSVTVKIPMTGRENRHVVDDVPCSVLLAERARKKGFIDKLFVE